MWPAGLKAGTVIQEQAQALSTHHTGTVQGVLLDHRYPWWGSLYEMRTVVTPEDMTLGQS